MFKGRLVLPIFAHFSEFTLCCILPYNHFPPLPLVALLRFCYPGSPCCISPTHAMQNGGYNIEVDPISAAIVIINRQNSRSWSGDGTANVEFIAENYNAGAYVSEKSSEETVQFDTKSSEETIRVAPALHWSMCPTINLCPHFAVSCCLERMCTVAWSG